MRCVGAFWSQFSCFREFGRDWVGLGGFGWSWRGGEGLLSIGGPLEGGAKTPTCLRYAQVGRRI
jgi:hypothetical protein